MIRLLGYVSTKNDLKIFRDAADFAGAMHEDDHVLVCNVFDSEKRFSEFFSDTDNIDICCCDTNPNSALETVRSVREKFPNMQLILITDAQTSPLTYIRPGVMPTSLLFRPLEYDAVNKAVDEVIRIIGNMNKNKTEGKFVLETKQGKVLIDYSRILFFEALDKRIYLNTANRSYPFYTTLDKLKDELPQSFIRCHKSYIVNTECINRVDYSENIIYMDGEITLPISRSYRSIIKELKL